MKDFGFRYVDGIPLLEIFSVSINKNDDDDDDGEGDRRSELYGTIQVVDGRGTNALVYDRGPENSEAVSQNKKLTLKSPHRCISALTSFTIDVDLKDRYDNLEISKGKISWGKQNDCYYDKRLSICVPGLNGSATVHCAVFSVAIGAALEITLMKTDDYLHETRYDEIDDDQDEETNDDQHEDQHEAGSRSDIILSDADVYGTIVASYGRNFDYSTSHQQKYFRITLFSRQEDDPVKLGPNNSIPLTRPLLALPAYSSMKIEADLFVCGSGVENVRGKTGEMVADFVMRSAVKGPRLTARVFVRGIGPYRVEDYK